MAKVQSVSDEYFMKLALKEGYKGLGKTSPNPPVGAVVVDALTGEVIAKGYHKEYGGPHAEVIALNKAGNKAKNSILYVTLEPCSHYGKTPPCTLKIIEAGIKKVICAIRDPNPVARGGLEVLKKHGIEVKSGVLSKEAKILTRFFLSKILRKKPWIIIKIASTLDGKIAVSTGDSKWITGEKARKLGHKLRAWCDAILIGKNTVLKDNPELTCRFVKGKNPIRIVFDTNLTLPLNLKIFEVSHEKRTIVVCGEHISEEKREAFIKKGVEIWKMPLSRGKIDVGAFLEKCYKEGISSILVEGGGKIHGSFLKEADEVFFFFGPLITGDPEGVNSVFAHPLKSLKQAVKICEVEVKKLGQDVLIHGYTEKGSQLINTPLE
jgi:diaminohydroxyphosphoribosylaminopyrimidine deaminase/5-amino-6-(5-phosphoribosylamino)uracil reductase